MTHEQRKNPEILAQPITASGEGQSLAVPSARITEGTPTSKVTNIAENARAVLATTLGDWSEVLDGISVEGAEPNLLDKLKGDHASAVKGTHASAFEASEHRHNTWVLD